MAALASIADVEAVSRPVPADDRSRVYRLLEMVSATVVRYTGQRFDESTSTITIHPHDGLVRLPQRPVTAIVDVRQGNRLLDASTYEVDPNGTLRRTWNNNLAFDYWGDDGDAWTGNGPYDPTGAPVDEWGWPAMPLRITYTHGYPVGSAPDDIRLVVAERVATTWTFGVEDVQATAIDGYSERYQKASHGQAWSPEHRDILDRYRRSGTASLRLG